MDAIRKLLDFIAGWFASLRSVSVFPAMNEKVESGSKIDPDFPRWIVNDPMVTLNPASRYGDDATGFLGGSERDEPERSPRDD